MNSESLQFLQSLPPIYVILTGLVVGFVVIVILVKRVIKPSVRKLKTFTLLQICSVILILLLAGADVYAMVNLFKGLELDRDEVWVYAFMIAFFLEGQPYYMSKALGDIIDGSDIRKERKINPIITLVLSTVGLVAAAALSMHLRSEWIELNGGRAEFQQGNYGNNNREYIGQIFLYWSPLLTSALAFVASWYALRTDRLEEQAKLVRKLFRTYLEAERDFGDAYQAFDEACTILWSSLANPVQNPRPSVQADFRQECFDRIRHKLVENCKINYMSNISEFNARIESELGKYIIEISQHTTIPEAITKITVKDIIDLYEARVTKNADKWDYNKAGPEMEAILQDTLNNAIVVAQFKSVTKPYRLEKDR